ncbi:MAG: phosphatase PAP2 family protein [Acidobacteriia bacterium]|nr:phosphatase PAP2 family protein [Terriglobia bacterium]
MLTDPIEVRERRFWPVDKLILAYLAFTTVLIVGWWVRIPDAPFLLAWHIGAAGLLLFEIKRPNVTSRVFRNWYPVLYVAACYREMAILIPPVRGWDGDRWLANLDYRLWRANPTVWLERIASPALTEFLQIAYTLFVPAVLLVAFLLWIRGQHRNFQYYAFLIAFGFLASYVGYLAVPARGPRFLLIHMQHMPLQGLWLFHRMQSALDSLESAHYDCFPSGHTELTILAWWGSRMVSKRLFQVYSFYTPVLIFATVYLRYHYSVDVLAGAVLAAIVIRTSPAIYEKLAKGA